MRDKLNDTTLGRDSFDMEIKSENDEYLISPSMNNRQIDTRLIGMKKIHMYKKRERKEPQEPYLSCKKLI